MQFTAYGVNYDTSEMQAYATGNAAEPTIYMDWNCRVFVKRVEQGKPVVLWASTAEIKGLTARYGIEELSRAARHTAGTD